MCFDDIAPVVRKKDRYFIIMNRWEGATNKKYVRSYTRPTQNYIRPHPLNKIKTQKEPSEFRFFQVYDFLEVDLCKALKKKLKR